MKYAKRVRFVAFCATALGALLAVAACPVPAVADDEAAHPRTFCNPMNMAYCFSEQLPSWREAADPTMVVFNDQYWLFATKTGGYWHSKDFVHWNLVSTDLPVDDDAPTALVMGGKMYWVAIGSGIWSTTDPSSGQWTKVNDVDCHGDPDLFLDDDGRLYLFDGCGQNGPISGQEVDPSTMTLIGDSVNLVVGDTAQHGFEIDSQPEDSVLSTDRPWIEGSWMTKHNGQYYLEYSAPGTQFNSYANGVYVSRHPLGPYTYAPYSPFSYKPTGFIGGAAHSSTFRDLNGYYWHIVTMALSIRHIFERRLGIFPTWFEPDGQIVTNTYLGDYPQYLPGNRQGNSDNRPGWMLLSYNTPATASTTLTGHPVQNAFDENIRDWWSAQTGDPGEWLQTNLGKTCRINAVQIDFADEGSTQLNRLQDGYGYKLQVSSDGSTWLTVVDRSVDMRDAPQDYIELASPVMAHYVRITNTHTPGGALFSLSGLRVFGNGLSKSPSQATGVQVSRNLQDQRQATITWNPANSVTGYIVRYGIEPDRLFSNYQVYDATSLHIHSLNIGIKYYFTVDSFNDTTVTHGPIAVPG